ncbi:MAG: hypothetical protein ACTSXC_02430 [Candidatus Freyarchaeota archaeon]|mgnify:CR=1 FL=1
MFRGVAVVSFDYRLGPVVEAVFPEGIIPGDKMWDISLDVWMSIFSRKITEENNQKVYGELGKLAYVRFCENNVNYALLALFDSDDGGLVWQLKDELEEVLNRGIEKLKKGVDSHSIARELYDQINGLVVGPKKFPSEVYESFKAVYDALSGVLKIVDEVGEAEVKEKLIKATAELTDKISDLALNLALTWGDREIISAILRRAEAGGG